jgi:hypothetical protein
MHGMNGIELNDIGKFTSIWGREANFNIKSFFAFLSWSRRASTLFHVFSLKKSDLLFYSSNGISSATDREAATIVIKMDGFVKHGEWGNLAFTSSEFLNGDTMFGPMVDGSGFVVAISMLEIITMFSAFFVDFFSYSLAVGADLPAVAISFDVA